MAIKIIPDPNMQPITSSGGKREGRLRWFAGSITPGTPIVPADIVSQFGFLLPRQGDVHPEDAGLLAVDWELDTVDDQRSALWTVEWVYRNVELAGPDTPLPEEVGFFEFSSELSAVTEEVWRVAPTIPTNGDVTANNTTDIGGTPCDIQGFPVTQPRRQQIVVIHEVITQATYQSRVNTYEAIQWTRNDATFEGSPIGRVVYLGNTANAIDVNKVRVSHKFAKDQFFHLQQLPLRDQTGDVVVDDTTDAAKEVYFRQPFPTKSDFSALSTAF
jgi:hypothetical protein